MGGSKGHDGGRKRKTLCLIYREFLLERKHVTDEILAVTPYQTDDYHEIDWQAALKDDEVAVVHILAVNPHFRNHGCAKAMMRKVISLADSKGLKAVRLDALACNVPAHRLYESLGFQKRDVHHWYAENTG